MSTGKITGILGVRSVECGVWSEPLRHEDTKKIYKNFCALVSLWFIRYLRLSTPVPIPEGHRPAMS